VQNFLNDKRIKISLIVFCVLIVYNFSIIALVKVESISDQSALTSYENAYWYSLVTLTTVGYGDLYPMTTYGRAIGYFFVFSSMVFYGLLIGNLTNLVSTIKESKKLGYNGTNFKNHAVIIGWNDFGGMVADQLISVGKQIAIVTNNRTDIDFIVEKYSNQNVFTLYNDLKNIDFLNKANISNSSIVFVNLEDDTEKLVYILNLKKYHPGLDFVVTLDNGDLKNTFYSAGVMNAISKHEISSKLLASYMFEPDVAQYSESILSVAHNDADYDIKQFFIIEQNPYVDKPYNDVFFDLKSKYNAILIGITKQDKFGQKKLIKNPMGDLKISKGDYLLMILNGKSYSLVKKVFGVTEGIKDKNS